MSFQRPAVVAVSGFSSNVGKTTLVCELLSRLPGWEAIKLTRGHYRSCGRDPISCCVSDLLCDEAVVRSGRDANYEAGKDTGRFWDAGASNVHWVIVQDHQVEAGINAALARVQAPGVVIEGNSFLDYVAPDLAVMCARSDGGTVKSSARRGLSKADFLYLSSLDSDGHAARRQFETWRTSLTIDLGIQDLPILMRENLPQLMSRVYQFNKSLTPEATSFASAL